MSNSTLCFEVTAKIIFVLIRQKKVKKAGEVSGVSAISPRPRARKARGPLKMGRTRTAEMAAAFTPAQTRSRSGKKRLASDLASTAGPPLESPAKRSRVAVAKKLGEKKNTKAVVAGGKGKDASTVIGESNGGRPTRGSRGKLDYKKLLQTGEVKEKLPQPEENDVPQPPKKGQKASNSAGHGETTKPSRSSAKKAPTKDEETPEVSQPVKPSRNSAKKVSTTNSSNGVSGKKTMPAKSSDDSASNKTTTQQTVTEAVGRSSRTKKQDQATAKSKPSAKSKSASKEKQSGAECSEKEVEAPDEVESVEEIEKFLHAMAKKGSLDWKDKLGQPAVESAVPKEAEDSSKSEPTVTRRGRKAVLPEKVDSGKSVGKVTKGGQKAGAKQKSVPSQSESADTYEKSEPSVSSDTSKNTTEKRRAAMKGPDLLDLIDAEEESDTGSGAAGENKVQPARAVRSKNGKPKEDNAAKLSNSSDTLKDNTKRKAVSKKKALKPDAIQDLVTVNYEDSNTDSGLVDENDVPETTEKGSNETEKIAESKAGRKKANTRAKNAAPPKTDSMAKPSGSSDTSDGKRSRAAMKLPLKPDAIQDLVAADEDAESEGDAENEDSSVACKKTTSQVQSKQKDTTTKDNNVKTKRVARSRAVPIQDHDTPGDEIPASAEPSPVKRQSGRKAKAKKDDSASKSVEPEQPMVGRSKAKDSSVRGEAQSQNTSKKKPAGLKASDISNLLDTADSDDDDEYEDMEDSDTEEHKKASPPPPTKLRKSPRKKLSPQKKPKVPSAPQSAPLEGANVSLNTSKIPVYNRTLNTSSASANKSLTGAARWQQMASFAADSVYDPEAYGVDEWGVADESGLGAAAGKPKKARKPRNKAGPKKAAPKKGPKQLVQMIQPPTNPQPATKSKKAPLTAPSNSSALFNALLPATNIKAKTAVGKKKTTAAPVPLVSAPPPHPATNATDFSIGCDAYLPSEDDYEPSIPEPPPPSNSAPQPKARMDDMVTVRTKTYKTPTVPNRVTSKVQQGKVSTPNRDEPAPAPAPKRSKAEEIKRCFGFDDSCSEDEEMGGAMGGAPGGGQVNSTVNNVSCNSTLAGISPVHRVQSSFLHNNRLNDASMLSPGASALDRPAKAKPARFVPHWGGSKKTAASAYHHQPSVLSSTTLSMKSTYLSPKNQLLPKTFANKPLLPPPLAPPRFAGEKSATTTSTAAANKENQEDQEIVVPPPSRTGADHIAPTAPSTDEAPPRRSPRKNAYEVLQSKNAGGSDGNKKASKKVVKKRPQVAQKSQAKAPTVKQTLVYETVGPDKVVKTAVKRTHEEQSVLFSDDEVYEDDSSKAKKAKEGAESVKGQPQKAEAGEKKKRPPKVYANRTLTSFSKSPTKQKRQLTNKKTAAVKAWETLQTSHFDDIDDVDLTFA